MIATKANRERQRPERADRRLAALTTLANPTPAPVRSLSKRALKPLMELFGAGGEEHTDLFEDAGVEMPEAKCF